jgi:hypothetical protein
MLLRTGFMCAGIEATITGNDGINPALSASIHWGDGTTDTFTGQPGGSKQHTYTTAGAKTITVVLTDEDGIHTNAGTRVVTLYAINPPHLIIQSNGQVALSFSGIPGSTYEFQRSIDLLNWTTLQTIAAPNDGSITWLDTAPPANKAFYRVKYNTP